MAKVAESSFGVVELTTYPSFEAGIDFLVRTQFLYARDMSRLCG